MKIYSPCSGEGGPQVAHRTPHFGFDFGISQLESLRPPPPQLHSLALLDELSLDPPL